MTIRKNTLAAIGASFILGLAVAVPAHAEATNDTSKWAGEFKASVERGEPLFHGGVKVNGNGVACVQCHPEATNIHAETYPKFQKQLGKVSSLWEMTNWCVENPMEGTALAPDSQNMTDLVAYMTYIRSGLKVEPGKF